MVEVSVILPNYNHKNYLKERIDSILNQTYQDFELIILDDHSSDNSGEIIELYRLDKRVSHIEYNAHNSGSPFRQWAKGINLAKGSFIWIAESDDSCEPTFLEKAIEKMKEYPSAGIVFSQSIEFEVESGKSYSSFAGHNRFSKAFEHSYFNEGIREIAGKMVYENTIPNASAVPFRKDIYLQTGGVEESMKLCGDWFLWIKMLLRSDIYFIAEPLNKFRLTPISVRAKHSKIDTFHERMTIFSFLSKNHVTGAGKAQIRMLKVLFNHYRISNLGKPLETAMREKKNIQNSRLKIFCAIILSLTDRIYNKIYSPARIQGA